MSDSMPFNAVKVDGKPDRAYKAEDWAWYFATFLSTGVFPKPSNGLQVIAFDQMEVKVNIGYAFINGYAFRNPETKSVMLDTAAGAANRIDRIVVRWDLTARDIYITTLKGVPSVKPAVPALTRNTEIYELALADIYVGKGVTKINARDITDQRFNSSVCGIVRGTIEEIDASVITKQFNDFFAFYSKDITDKYGDYIRDIKEYLEELEIDSQGKLADIVKKLTDFEGDSEQQWDEWFTGIRQTLTSVENGEMLAQILNLIKDLYNMATDQDIDAIIDGSYADVDDEGSIFEPATDQDIDDIIDGTYVDSETVEEEETV